MSEHDLQDWTTPEGLRFAHNLVVMAEALDMDQEAELFRRLVAAIETFLPADEEGTEG